MQPSNELSTTQRPRYMIDEFYNIGRPISPVVHIIVESRHGRGIGLRPDVTANVLGQVSSEETIDYDII